jgi:hypothetical protein
LRVHSVSLSLSRSQSRAWAWAWAWVEPVAADVGACARGLAGDMLQAETAQDHFEMTGSDGPAASASR